MSGTGPLATGDRIVPAEWIDYIGHMNDGYYLLAFTQATESFLDQVDLGAQYRARSDRGMYTVECHLVFTASARAGDRLSFSTWLLGADAKRLHVLHRMAAGGPDGETEAATCELMFLHVDVTTDKVVPMAADRLAGLTALADAHAASPAPAAGRRIAIPVANRGPA